MAKVRLIAAEPRIVPWLGSQTIQPDEIVTVPDAQLDAYACQPQVWEVIEEPAAAAPAPVPVRKTTPEGGSARTVRKEGE